MTFSEKLLCHWSWKKEGTPLVQKLWIKLYFSLAKIARPPWQAHCNLFNEGLNVQDFFGDLSHADLNCRWNFWKWFRLWGDSRIPGEARFNQTIIRAGCRVTGNEIRLPSLSGDQRGIVCHDKVAAVWRPVRVSRMINLLAWSGWLREAGKRGGEVSPLWDSCNAMKLNWTVQPAPLITNGNHLGFSTLQTQTVISTASPVRFGPRGLQALFHQAALAFAMECDRKRVDVMEFSFPALDLGYYLRFGFMRFSPILPALWFHVETILLPVLVNPIFVFALWC